MIIKDLIDKYLGRRKDEGLSDFEKAEKKVQEERKSTLQEWLDEVWPGFVVGEVNNHFKSAKEQRGVYNQAGEHVLDIYSKGLGFKDKEDFLTAIGIKLEEQTRPERIDLKMLLSEEDLKDRRVSIKGTIVYHDGGSLDLDRYTYSTGFTQTVEIGEDGPGRVIAVVKGTKGVSQVVTFENGQYKGTVGPKGSPIES